MRSGLRVLQLVLLAALLPGTRVFAQTPAAAPAPEPARTEIWRGFEPSADLRLRWEHAHQKHLRESDAVTTRLRLGLLSPALSLDALGLAALGLSGLQLRGFAELEGTRAANDDTYRAASVEGPRNRTVIADPGSRELNQAWLQLSGFDSTLRHGRQRIVLDNARFVGNVGWRQNEQTYDAIRFSNESLPHLQLEYAYVWNVERIFGSKDRDDPTQDDFGSHTHLWHLAWSRFEQARLAAYVYDMDLRDGSPTPASRDASNRSYGMRLSGIVPWRADWRLRYAAEYAYQTDSGSRASDYRASYSHAELAALVGDFEAGAGYEQLGSSSKYRVGFQTPLATLHAFNGHADVFLATPATGLVDFYGFAGVKLPAQAKLRAVYHDFVQANSRGDLGGEWDLQLSKGLPRGVVALLKYARFDSHDTSLRDVRRLWLELSYRFPESAE